jgi:two-component system cell cycle sensor histidine kinase/response regulator CckA
MGALWRTGDASGGRSRFRMPERWFLLGLAVTCFVAGVDFLTPEFSLTALLVTGPLLTSVRSGPRNTALVGFVALALTFPTGFYDGILGTHDFWIRTGAVLLVSALAIWAARVRERVESAAAEQNERLRVIVENSADGLFLADGEGIIRYGSLSTARIVGYAPAELIGRSLYDFMAAGDAAHVRLLWAECLQTPELPVEVAFRFKRKDGSWADISGVAVNRLDGPGEAAIVLNFRDIGDRLRAEEALRVTQQFNEAIIEGAGEGIVVYDRELRYVAWNPYMERMTGMPEAQVLGHRAEELFPFLKSSGILRYIERALEGERATADDVEWRMAQTGKSGWVSASYSPHRNASGGIVGVIAMIRDVSDRVRAEEVIRTRERQLAEAQRVAQLGSWEWDVPSDTVFWSDELCRICGIPPDVAPSNLESVLLLVHPEDRNMVEREVRSAVRDVRPIAFDARFLRGSGPPRILQARGRVASDDRGNPLRLVATAHDITEAREAEQALRVRDRAIEVIPQAVLITDYTQPDNPVVYANPSFETLTGYSAAEMVGKNTRILQGPATDPTAVAKLRAGVRGGQAVNGVRILNYRKDGSPFWNSVSITPIRDESGRVTHFVGVLSAVEQPVALAEVAGRRT